MEDKLLDGVGGQVREMVDDLYPRLVKEAQSFLAKHDLKDEQTRKDVLFAALFSCGMLMGSVEGMALQLGVSPESLLNMTPKLLASGRMAPLRPDPTH